MALFQVQGNPLASFNLDDSDDDISDESDDDLNNEYSDDDDEDSDDIDIGEVQGLGGLLAINKGNLFPTTGVANLFPTTGVRLQPAPINVQSPTPGGLKLVINGATPAPGLFPPKPVAVIAAPQLINASPKPVDVVTASPKPIAVIAAPQLINASPKPITAPQLINASPKPVVITAPVLAPMPTAFTPQPITTVQLQAPNQKQLNINEILAKMPGISLTVPPVIPGQADDINVLIVKEGDETPEDFEARRRLTLRLVAIPDYKLNNVTAVVAALIMMRKSKLGITYDIDVENAIAYLMNLLQR